MAEKTETFALIMSREPEPEPKKPRKIKSYCPPTTLGDLIKARKGNENADR